jgi:TfoX/Sxy family transcriptional regulator of competence genes
MTAASEALARRLRKLLERRQGIVEKRVVGGTGFMLHGNFALGITGKGDLMVRVDPADAPAALSRPGAYQMQMGDRDMVGYVGVTASEIDDPDELRRWVLLGLDYARTLPPK